MAEIKPKNGEIPDTDLLKIDGYDLFTNSNYKDADTRGVCIYTRSDLQASEVEIPSKLLFKDSVWVTIPDKANKLTLIGNVYRSGTPSKAKTLDNNLHELIKYFSLSKKFDKVIITGDFNHSSVKWKEDGSFTSTDPADEDFIECIRDSFLHQHVLKPTRIVENHQSLLDLILSNDPDIVNNIEYDMHIGNSDHISLIFEVPTDIDIADNVDVRVKYKYSKANIQAIKQKLNIDWEIELKDKSSEEAYKIFCDKYYSAIDAHVPKYKNVNKNILPTKPVWMTRQTEKLVKEKHHAWIRYLNTKHPKCYEAYKYARNKVSHALQVDRRRYETGIALEIRKNVKAFWKYVNKNKKLKKKIPNLLRKDKTLAQTDKEKADTLNQQFESVFTVEGELPPFPDRNISSLLQSIVITEEMVQKKLKNLRVDKSPGLDNIHPFILNHCSTVLSKPLQIIYQISLGTGILPSVWKDGLISPLFKKGKRNLPVNYRPVCLTSIPCKTLESLIVDEIHNHILLNNLKQEKQHGFTIKRSTITNLLQAINIWLDALSHNIPVDVIYFDYSKAFDKVPHQRLLKQLESLGIKSQVLSWISNFLTGRTQRVTVNGIKSNPVLVTSGVPQGSVLGPILFLLYIMDAPDQVNNFMSLFADDSKLFCPLLELGLSTSQLQEDISALSIWSNKMLMSYNTDKCHTLHLGRNNPICEDPTQVYQLPIMQNVLSKSNSQSYDLKLYELKPVEAEKDLGVLVDNRLNFNHHIDAKISKAYSMLAGIRKIFKFINSDIFSRLY